jgi:thiol-disulfide isomerase/thioredoxin
MKRSIFPLFCCIALTACAPQRPAMVENPSFEVRNSRTIEIARIEMNDSATVFHIDAFYQPKYWIKIASDAYIRPSGTQEKLVLTHAEGIEPDKEFWMPESGTASFKLYFPPLPPEVTRIDFLEGDCDNCFKTWGIRLLPSDKVEMEPLPSATIPATQIGDYYNPQTTRISGRVIGYLPEYDGEVSVSLGNDIITNIDHTFLATLADDGTFSGEVVVSQPMLAIFEVSANQTGASSHVFIVPGKDLTITVDMQRLNRLQSRLRTDKEPSDSTYIAIEGSPFTAAQATGMYQTSEIVNTIAFFRDIVGMNPEAYKAHVLKVLHTKMADIDATDNTEAVKEMMKSCAQTYALNALLRYSDVMQQAIRLDQSGAHKDMKIESPTADYYSFLPELLNKQLLYFGSSSFADRLAKLNVLDSLGDEGQLWSDLAKAHNFAGQLQQGKPLTDTEKATIEAAFADNPQYAQALFAANEKVVRDIAASRNTEGVIINETPDVANAQLLDAIVAKYKGKVLFVDFWATWCGPCIQANRIITPYKEEMKGTDLVFIYLTGETSPLDRWYAMIPTLHGEHYRVNNEQWNYWMDNLKIEGIPTYLIFDKQGKQTYRSLAFPGIDTVREEIAKIL